MLGLALFITLFLIIGYPLLTLSILFVGFYYILYLITRRKILKIGKIINREQTKLVATLEENFDSLKEIKIYNLNSLRDEQFQLSNYSLRRIRLIYE